MSKYFGHIFCKGTMMLTGLLIFLPSILSAQLWRPQGGDTAKKSRFEAGLSIYSYYIFEPGISSRTNDFARGNYYSNGVYSRLWHHGNAFRFGFHHFEDDLNFNGPNVNNEPFFLEDPFPATAFLNSAIRKMISAQMGYQVFVTNTKLSPYFFGDVLFQNSNEQVFYTKESVVNGFPTTKNLTLVSKSNHLGLTAGLGLRLQLNSFLTISFESQMQGYYAWNRCNDKAFLSKNGAKISLFPAQFLLGFYL